ncbi:RNA polymerase factor sigma-70 [Microbulbifer sp. 2304DJ12-6]|uniref:RNA polymerase factor sigma-70 n=1 Tax=Microbulbifer sp. 2304DJ12-6 TaxID=3233340 RepID=UPI002609C043|nr:RNA polymerase factor sigma-70 [uncultured Microbulbifer sp.]
MSDHLTPDASPGSSAQASLQNSQFLVDLRQQMLRFARLQLQDAQLSEDAVQEALMGALKNSRSFSGCSALKTWVFAILKNKIADILRQRRRFVDADQLVRKDREAHNHDELFDQSDHWQKSERPKKWVDPESAIYDKHFWRIFEACLSHLPARQAQLFMMREFIELESHEICASAEISVSNLNVTLHRARLRLRECLEDNWFGVEG